jgi:hypothetical protein
MRIATIVSSFRFCLEIASGRIHADWTLSQIRP